VKKPALTRKDRVNAGSVAPDATVTIVGGVPGSLVGELNV